LSFVALWTSPGTASGQMGHDASAAKIGNVLADPYTPLRLYEGKWDLIPKSADKPSDSMHLENRCAKVGEFFSCNQFCERQEHRTRRFSAAASAGEWRL
jgi:hypothetical protein